MPKFPLNYRLARVLRFLTSLRYPDVAARMTKRGFDVEEAERGWALLDKAMGRHLSMRLFVELPDMSPAEVLSGLVEWQRVSFDIADASLRFEHPTVHARLFRDLTKVRNVEVLMNVESFLQRLDELAEEEEDAEVQAALTLLEKRGLDGDRAEAGHALLDRLRRSDLDDADNGGSPAEFEAVEEQRQRDEAALWSWYLSWSQIARTVVESKRLRIRMGISQMGRTSASGDESEPEDEDEDTDTPLAPYPLPTRPTITV